mgnify:CR=1 FL=1
MMPEKRVPSTGGCSIKALYHQPESDSSNNWWFPNSMDKRHLPRAWQLKRLM